MAYSQITTKQPARERRPHRAKALTVPRRSTLERSKLTWGSAAVAEAGDTLVEVDEAIEADVWKLSIDTPACYVSVQIEGRVELAKLEAFLRRADSAHPLGALREYRIPRSSTVFVWDDETSGRLFLWLGRAGKNSIRAELGQQQAECIRSALAEAV